MNKDLIKYRIFPLNIKALLEKNQISIRYHLNSTTYLKNTLASWHARRALILHFLKNLSIHIDRRIILEYFFSTGHFKKRLSPSATTSSSLTISRLRPCL